MKTGAQYCRAEPRACAGPHSTAALAAPARTSRAPQPPNPVLPRLAASPSSQHYWLPFYRCDGATLLYSPALFFLSHISRMLPPPHARPKH